MTLHKESNVDASSDTMHELEQRHTHPHVLPSIADNIHNDSIATSVALPIEQLPMDESEMTLKPQDEPPVSATSSPTHPQVHQGFWKQRLLIRPAVEGDPRTNFSRIKKGIILAVISQAGCLGGFSSTIY
ncbi:hypothetical protein BGZ80_009784, partial [Entomortierella chlamydospora]